MDTAKPLFDRKLLRARRARGARLDGDAFLHHRVADDAIERVLDINRTFTRSLLIGDAALNAAIINKAREKLGEVIRAEFNDETRGLDLVVDEEALPFTDARFDFVFSGLGLHSVNAVPRALMDIKRVLKPDGLFIAALFGGETLRELRHALYEAEDTVKGCVSPRISPMIDVQQAAGLLQKCGFAMPVIDRDKVTVRYRALERLFADLRRMGESNILIDRARSGASKGLFDSLNAIYHRDHTQADGTLMVGFDIIWMTGWSPHKDQPKPLKPGSAKTRLSDALGVKEHKL